MIKFCSENYQKLYFLRKINRERCTFTIKMIPLDEETEKVGAYYTRNVKKELQDIVNEIPE
jgi:hypothetical protein